MLINPAPVPWITVSPASPALLSGVSVPGIPDFSARLAPYAFQVSNTASTPVVGIVVMFGLQNNGKAINRAYFLNTSQTPSAPPALPPGGNRIFTPFAEVNNQLGGIKWPTPTTGGGSALSASRANYVFTLLESTPTPSITIDLVIAADGRFAGPDASCTIRSMQRTKDAYTDLRAEVLSLLSAGAADSDLVAMLSAKGGAPIQVDPACGGRGEPYSQAQMLTAGRWLAQYRAAGRAALAQSVTGDTPDRMYPFVANLREGLQ